jgi:hypothetical protein
MKLFYLSRRNHLAWARIVSDDDYGLTVGRWLNGRLFGCYVNVFIPYFWR